MVTATSTATELRDSGVYFLDPGIRNVLMNDFGDLSIRPDLVYRFIRSSMGR